eukprot:103570_1
MSRTLRLETLHCMVRIHFMHIIIWIIVLYCKIIFTDAYNTTRISEQPTVAPTIFYPLITDHPSLNPSSIQCNTLHGSDAISDDVQYPLFPDLKYNINASINTSYIGTHLTCPNNESCYYGCLSDGVCLKSKISCNSYHGCNIKCLGYYSCASMTITSSSVSNAVITIICDQPFACNDMRIDGVSFIQVHVHCITEDSCHGMNVIIHSSLATSSVSCYDTHACDDIYYYSISTGTSQATNTLFMYKYSKHIIVRNINDIRCMDDTHFIRYTKSITRTQIKQQISDDKPSCSGIHQICGNNSCDVTYSVHDIDTKYIKDMVDHECYYIPVHAVTERTCHGCNEVRTLRNTSDTNRHDNNGVAWFMLTVLLISFIISFLSYLYNMHPKSLVDSARTYAPIMVTLQIINIWTDINLCVEIFDNASFTEHILILLSGVGVLTFIFLPYLINIILTQHIKSIIRSNIACKQYFETPNECGCIRHTSYVLFIIVMTVSGSAWCSLLLLSSQIFGIHVLNNGLTTHDLMQLLAGPKSIVFIASHTICHNIPQLVFQCLYCVSIQQITSSVSLAFISSLVTLVVFFLFYLVEKQKMSLYHTVQYYLEISTKSKRELHQNEDAYALECTQLILANKGKKAKLVRRIQSIFGNEHEHKLEIGYTALTSHGCLTHFVSRINTNDISSTYLKPDELKRLKDSNNSASHTFLKDANDTDLTQMIGNQYIKNVYLQNIEHLTECFRSCYGIDTQINITYHALYPHDLDIHEPPQSSFIELFTLSRLPTETYTKIHAITQQNPPSPDGTEMKKCRLRRTQSNPLAVDKALFTVAGAKKKKHVPHVRLIDSDHDDTYQNAKICSAESTSEENYDEEDAMRRSSDTSEEHIDYGGELSHLTMETAGFTKSPRSFGSITRNKSYTMIGTADHSEYKASRQDDVLSLGRCRSMSIKKSNLRILYRFDGWPEPQVIKMYKFNQIQNGLNVRSVLQYVEQHLKDEHNDVLEYAQLRFATNPTYIMGKRGWKQAFPSSFIPFLIGDDGVNEIDIWLRTKGFINEGVGKQLKFKMIVY